MKAYIVSAFEDRREYLSAQLAEQGIKHQYINPREISDYKIKSLSAHPHWRDKRNPRLMTQGEVECVRGHVKALTMIRDYETVGMVLEDDADIIGKIISHQEFNDRDVDLLYLGGKRLGEDPDFYWWTIGYVVTPRAAHKILEDIYSREHILPMDEMLPHTYTGVYSNNNLDLIPARKPYLVSGRVNPWVVQPRGLASETEDSPCAFNLKVAVFATDREKAKDTIDKYKFLGYDVHVLGEGASSWDATKEGGAQKLKWLTSFLGQYTSSRDIVLASDGYDVVPDHPPEVLLKRYGEMLYPTIVSGETTWWPKRDIEFRKPFEFIPEYPGEDIPAYKYPCSGLFMGSAARLLNHLQSAIDRYGDDVDDQAIIQRMVLDFPHTIRIDREAYLFRSEYKAHPLDYKGIDSVTGTMPLITHYNNNSKPNVQKPQPAWSDKLFGLSNKTHMWSGDLIITPVLDSVQTEVLRQKINATDWSKWGSLENDNVPGDELRDDIILEEIRTFVEENILPILREQCYPANIKGIKDIFAIRHGKRTKQQSLRLHTDISQLSGNIVVQKAEKGGALYFPRQNWSDSILPVGTGVWWPGSSYTHPHTTLPVTEGERLSITIWTH